MNSRHRQFVSTPKNQRGLALVMVLWLIMLLSIIAMGHTYNVHIETRLAAAHVQTANARASVEAGLNIAILQLLTTDSATPWPIDGTVGRFQFADANILIAIRDATGLIDLNAAGPDLLQNLATALEVDPTRQAQIVGAILDWRDRDDLTHLDGAEDADYVTSGLPWTPRDGAFSSVEELRYVMGITQQLFNDMAPFVTVYSEQAGINLEFAAPFLIQAMQGQNITPAVTARPRSNDQSILAAGSGTYHIYVSSTNNEGTGASAEAVMRVTEDSDNPYRILYWRDSMRTQFPDDAVAGS
jgi:general secretion pathway protein K